jgi:hypothetical protein
MSGTSRSLAVGDGGWLHDRGCRRTPRLKLSSILDLVAQFDQLVPDRVASALQWSDDVVELTLLQQQRFKLLHDRVVFALETFAVRDANRRLSILSQFVPVLCRGIFDDSRWLVAGIS